MNLRCRLGVHRYAKRHHILPSGKYILIFAECFRCGAIESWGVAEIVSHEIPVVKVYSN